MKKIEEKSRIKIALMLNRMILSGLTNYNKNQPYCWKLKF